MQKMKTKMMKRKTMKSTRNCSAHHHEQNVTGALLKALLLCSPAHLFLEQNQTGLDVVNHNNKPHRPHCPHVIILSEQLSSLCLS